MSESTAAPAEGPDLLRFLAAGSVDDGKSTLIGRLLYDSKSVYADHLRSLEKDSKRGQAGGRIDYSLLTDGLLAEREQGITIDVAYRYFATPRRKFIIADTPGHEQYTRNMATGASTADLAIVLVDAGKGVLPQTRRHSFIASLLGIRHLVVAVNKMDLVGWSREVFERIRADYADFAARIEVPDVHFLPISALEGDNVVERSGRMPWFQGAPLLEHLETVHIASDRNLIDLRFPVQLVVRPDRDFRGYAGTVASGRVRPGDEVVALPGGRTTRVASIVTRDGPRPEAFPPLAVTLTLEDEIDLSRGDMLVHPGNRPAVARAFEAMVVWMAAEPMEPGAAYLVKHTTATVRAKVAGLRYRVDVNTIHRTPAERLAMNEIGRVTLECARPLMIDPYKRNRSTGAFILVDPTSNVTVGAGMILDQVVASGPAGQGLHRDAPPASVLAKLRLEAFLASGATLPLPAEAAPELSILVPAEGPAELLLACLAALPAATARPAEVLVAGEGAGEALAPLLRRLGGARSFPTREAAAAAARGRWLAVIAPDLEVLPGALDLLARSLEADPGAARAFGRVLGLDATELDAGEPGPAGGLTSRREPGAVALSHLPAPAPGGPRFSLARHPAPPAGSRGPVPV